VRRTTLGVLIILIAAGAIALAAFSRLHHDLAIDEPFTALAAAHPASLGATLVHDNTPLYYALLIAWTRLFGASAFALRALSLAAFGGAIAFSAAAARRVASQRAAWLTALLVGFSVTFGLEPAATARPYALAALFAAMTLWAALGAGKPSSGVRGALPLLTSHLLGLFTHPVFVFVTAASAIAGLVWAQAKSQKWILFGAPATALGLYLATWWPMLRQTAGLPARTWMPRPGFHDLIAGTLLWGDHGTPVIAGVLGVLIVVTLADRKSRSDPGVLRGGLFAVTIAALVLAGAFVVSQITPVYLPARTPIFVLPAVSVAAGVALAELAHRLVVFAVAGMVAVSAGRHTMRSSNRPDPFPTRASLAAVAGRMQCGDVIVAGGLSYAPIAYYAAGAGVPACVSITAFPENVRDHPGWLDMSDGARAAIPARAAAEAAKLPAAGTLWMFAARDGIGQAEAAALVRELAARRDSQGTVSLPGSFFDDLRVFGPSKTAGARP
jgi:hypothetical protein